MNPKAGFLVVLTFPALYRRYLNRYELTRDVYAVPRIDREPEKHPIQYRGLDRDALSPLADEAIRLWLIEVGRSYTPAELRLGELQNAGKAQDDFIFQHADAVAVIEEIGRERADYELVWTRIAACTEPAPDHFRSIGFEPTYFTGDHFSASCDCMLIPRWHGTDEEGELFIDHFRNLNRHGMFPTSQQAESFLEYYLSFDWTETGDYEIAEIFLPDEAV